MECICKKMVDAAMATSPKCIGQHWVFQNLEKADFKALVQDALRKKSPKGQPLFIQGDPANEMFLIKAGRIKLNKILEDGTEITLDIRKAGDFVGENMFSEEVQYPVSAYCLEDTFTCGFTKEHFEKIVLEHPKIGLQIIKNFSERISWLTSRVGSLAATNIEDRLYRVLANVAKQMSGRPNEEDVASAKAFAKDVLS